MNDLAGIVERWRPEMLKIASYWCRRGPDIAEDLVQDACARMAERESLPPPDPRAERAFVRKWLQTAWASYWQNQRTQKRSDQDRDAASLDELTSERGDDAPPKLVVRDPLDVEATVLHHEHAQVVSAVLGALDDDAKAAVRLVLVEGPRRGRPRVVPTPVKEAIRTRLSEAGYPFSSSGREPYARDRSFQMSEYNRRRRTSKKGEAA